MKLQNSKQSRKHRKEGKFAGLPSFVAHPHHYHQKRWKTNQKIKGALK